MNRTLAMWGAEAGSGRRTITRLLAEQWTEKGQSVLWLHFDASHGEVSQPLDWISRFQSLAPNLLRNTLMDGQVPYAVLNVKAIPPVESQPDMMALLKRAFDWILLISPQEGSPEELTLLDHCDLLLWVAKPETSSTVLKKRLDDLATAHFPHAISQFILNQVPPSSIKSDSLLEILPGRKILGAMPQDAGPRFRLQEAVHQLAETLAAREDLWTPKKRTSGAEGPADQLIQELKNRVQPELLKVMDPNASKPGATSQATAELAQKTVEACMAQDATLSASREERSQILTRVLDEVLGLGPIEPLLKDPAVSEIMVNGKDNVYVETQGRLHPVDVRFSSDAQLRTVIDRIVSPIGRRVDESMPLCDARLADGSRVNIVLPPLALDGPTITIRKFMARALNFEDLVARGSMSAPMAEFLTSCVKGHKNMIVSGGTGSGKTTLLNALSSMIPENERIVTIEDAAELRLQKPHVVRLESRPPNAEGEGAIPIRRLVINALRMRPDRIVVGECRGGEALDMLQAMNTGHDGSLTTLHANTPRDGLGRLETLVLMAGMDLPVRVVREQIRSAVHLIIQQARLTDGSRKVTSITEVTGMEGETLTIQEIFRWRDGKFEATGVRPRFFDQGHA